MNDEQRRVALFQTQPEGLGLFSRPAALSFAHVESLHLAHAALLDEKRGPAEPIALVLTGPSQTAIISGNAEHNPFSKHDPCGHLLRNRRAPYLPYIV